MENEKVAKKKKDSSKIPPFVAKRDFVLHQNKTHLYFVKGEKYTLTDKKWEEPLKAEKVI
jgi:hypothetical protein